MSALNRRHQTLDEWTKSGSLRTKSSRGWIHPDHQLCPDAGVTYAVRYTGSMPVLVSMKSVDFDTRSKVAKECINSVCESAGMKLPSRSQKKDKKLMKLLGERPNMRGSGCNANITITTECITVLNTDTGEMITNHNLFNVSFASGGEAETIDFVSFVAKDDIQGRACHVIESPGGLASDIISTIGQAFEVRYKDHIGRGTSNTASLAAPSASAPLVQVPERDLMLDSWGEPGENGAQHECPTGTLIEMDTPPPPNDGSEKRPPINISFPPPPAAAPQQPAQLPPVPSARPSLHAAAAPVPVPAHTAASGIGVDPSSELAAENWFHGRISRLQAEGQLTRDGDFLVRESTNAPPGKQFVLSGKQAGRCKHLLLIDPDGKVRTKEREFPSVVGMVHFHLDNALPIISKDFELQLRRPVTRQLLL